MKSIRHSAFARVLCASALAASSDGLSHRAEAALPPGNAAQQWNKIAEDTVVGSGVFQNEGLIYMAYVSAASYDAVVGIQGGFEPYASRSMHLLAPRPTQPSSRQCIARCDTTSRRRSPRSMRTMQRHSRSSRMALPRTPEGPWDWKPPRPSSPYGRETAGSLRSA
jgi:hypothetical protein